MTWVFQQSTGHIYDPTGVLVTTTYAGGNCGNNPEGLNNPAMQDVKCVGPLPQGLYTFGQPENSSKLGPFAIPLIPDPANTMYDRGGFFAHGDTVEMDHAASEGCIITNRGVRMTMWGSEDHQLTVIA